MDPFDRSITVTPTPSESATTTKRPEGDTAMLQGPSPTLIGVRGVGGDEVRSMGVTVLALKFET